MNLKSTSADALTTRFFGIPARQQRNRIKMSNVTFWKAKSSEDLGIEFTCLKRVCVVKTQSVLFLN